MSVRWKVVLILFVAFAMFVATSHLVQRWVLVPSFARLECNEAYQDLNRCLEAVRRDVAFVPGDAFFTTPNPPPTARLNFSCMPEDAIIEGIRRLSEAVKDAQPRAVPAPAP
jgi:aspartate/methionine/tyrosine aminotransferase